MRILVDHFIPISFSYPQPRVALALRVTPEDSHDQTVANWRIGPDCDARLRDGRDGFGNVLTMLYAEGPLERIEIHVGGEVFTGPSSGILGAGHAEPLPPALFLRAGGDAASPELVAIAVDAAAASQDDIDRLHLANVALHNQAIDDPAQRVAIFTAAARRMSFPARCVSGYLADDRGAGVPHVWAEAHVERVGWVGFDPATGLSAGEDHARVASALDLAGIAPVVGLAG
jgi:hypothetical protein